MFQLKSLITTFHSRSIILLLLLYNSKVHCRSQKQIQNYCSIESYQSCLTIIEEVSRSEQLAFATTPEELEKSCSRMKEGVQCTDEHMKRCTSRNIFQAFEEVVEGSRKVFNDLCQPGPTQNDYLRFAACYKMVMFKYMRRELECRHWINLLSSLQFAPAPVVAKSPEQQQDDLRTFCCAYNKSIQCQADLIRYHCDEEALEFFHKNSQRMSEKLIQQHCAQFDRHHRIYCRFNGSVEDAGSKGKTQDLGAVALLSDSGSKRSAISSTHSNAQGLPSRRTLPGQTVGGTESIMFSHWLLIFLFFIHSSLMTRIIIEDRLSWQ